MKKFVTFAMAAVLCLSMGMTAMAATSVSKDTTVGKTVAADGTELANPTVTAITDETEEGKALLKEAESAKPKAGAGNTTVIHAVIDLTASADIQARFDAGEKVKITLNVPGIASSDKVSVLHKKADGTWETLAATAGTNIVTAEFSSLSPVAIVKEVPTTGTAPKTGEFGFAGILSVIVVCGAGLVLVNRKKAA